LTAKTPAKTRILILGPPVIEPATGAVGEAFGRLRTTDLRLLALLALSPHRSVLQRDLIHALWPQLRFRELLEDEEALDVEQAAVRQKRIEGGIDDLRNSASRLRKFLRLAAGDFEHDPVKLKRSDEGAPASGAYALALHAHVTVDAAELTALLSEGDNKARVAALHLFRGGVLHPDNHSSVAGLRSKLITRVKNAARQLLPAAHDKVLDQVAREIVLEGETATLDARYNSSKGLAAVADAASVAQLQDQLLPVLESSVLTGVAVSTLKELVFSWTGDLGVTTPSDNVVTATLPAQWGEVPPMRVHFFVFASEGAPDLVTDPVDGIRCLRHRISRREFHQLVEYCQIKPAPRAYCVLATPVPAALTIGSLLGGQPSAATNLIDRPPVERFRFYIVDVVQFVARFIELEAYDEGELLFPAQNVLNLALFSLLWASRWVEEFFRPLTETHVVKNLVLSEQIGLVFNRTPPLDHIKERGWGPLVKDLPRMRGEFDRDLFQQVSFRLGMGSAMQLINKQMIDASGSLTEVRTYCPEALYGTVNLWLFSRSYHQFMTVTTGFARDRPGFVNQRLLPTHGELAGAPRMLTASLWHVLLYYRMLEAQVRIVHEPPDAGAEDHGYYGGGIGEFQWIRLTPDTGDWVLHQEKKTVQRDHRMFLHDAANNTLVGPDISIEGFAGICALTQHDQLALERTSPSLLFPPENDFIEHPHLLWSERAGAARMQGPK
jgi:hypothetical protein